MYPDTLPSSSVISIHAPRAGGDGKKRWSSSHNLKFQSTPPVRGATNAVRVIYVVCTISIHAPRAGGDGFPALSLAGFQISIHAPRAGGDPTAAPLPPLAENFNPRPPCGGRPPSTREAMGQLSFQSTPPVRGATQAGRFCPAGDGISIHAPRAGGDTVEVSGYGAFDGFQSTPPVRGATGLGGDLGYMATISIHAPRAGGDVRGQIAMLELIIFQSTPPVRGATLNDFRSRMEKKISIHAPRAGGDCHTPVNGPQASNFNPRPPCGGRPPGPSWPRWPG